MSYSSAIYTRRLFERAETTLEEDYSDAARRYALTGSASYVPAGLCCPISKDLMQDPVVLYDAATGTAGNTYDRANIDKWLYPPGGHCNRKEPLGGWELDTPRLVQNLYAKSFVEAFKTRHAAALREYAEPARRVQRAFRRHNARRVRTQLLKDLLQDASLAATAKQVDYLRRKGADLDAALGARQPAPPIPGAELSDAAGPDDEHVLVWRLPGPHAMLDSKSPPFRLGAYQVRLILSYWYGSWGLRTRCTKAADGSVPTGEAPLVSDTCSITSSAARSFQRSCDRFSLWRGTSGCSGVTPIPGEVLQDRITIVYTLRTRPSAVRPAPVE